MLKNCCRKAICFACVLVAVFVVFSFTAAAAMRGDVDGNGRLTAADARIVLRIAAKLDIPDEQLRLAADVNSSGTVTSADARLILRVSAGIDSFAEEETTVPSTDPPVAVEPTTKLPETTTNNPDIEDEVQGGASNDNPGTKIYALEDILGTDAKNYIEAFNLVKGANGRKNVYDGENISLQVLGSASKTPDMVDYVEILRNDVSVQGITTGMTLAQAKQKLDGKTGYSVEDVSEESQVLVFNMDRYSVYILFENDFSIAIYGGNFLSVNYCCDSMIDSVAEYYFTDDVNNFEIIANEDGTLSYVMDGMTAIVCNKFGVEVIDTIILEGESDYSFGYIYTGAAVEELREICESFDMELKEKDDGVYFAENYAYTAEFFFENGVLVKAVIVSCVRPYEQGQCTDLAFLMGNHVSEVSVITGLEPYPSDFDKNTFMFSTFYLVTEGCFSKNPSAVCCITVYAPGYGFNGIDYGMPQELLLSILDEKGAAYNFNAEGNFMQIPKGEYGDYAFYITFSNGCVDWVEVSTEVYEGIYDIANLLMIDVLSADELFAGYDIIKTEDNEIKIMHDCVIFTLTESEDRLLVTGIEIIKTCDFNFRGMFVGEDVTLIESELLGMGFSEFTEGEDYFSTCNDAFEIIIYVESGCSTGIELRAI